MAKINIAIKIKPAIAVINNIMRSLDFDESFANKNENAYTSPYPAPNTDKILMPNNHCSISAFFLLYSNHIILIHECQ
jgi:hypothetical protein